MKTVQRLFMALMVMFFGCVALKAQSIMKTELNFTKPLRTFSINGTKIDCDPKQDKIKVCYNIFGSNYSYAITLSGPSVAEITEGAGLGKEFHCTYYGRISEVTGLVHYTDAQSDTYQLTNGQVTDGIVGKVNGYEGWVFIIAGKMDNCVTNVYEGMTLNEVNSVIKSDLGSTCSLKANGKSGALTKYTLFSYGMSQGFGGETIVNDNTAYAHFFFNAQNKLVKWYMAK